MVVESANLFCSALGIGPFFFSFRLSPFVSMSTSVHSRTQGSNNRSAKPPPPPHKSIHHPDRPKKIKNKKSPISIAVSATPPSFFTTRSLIHEQPKTHPLQPLTLSACRLGLCPPPCFPPPPSRGLPPGRRAPPKMTPAQEKNASFLLCLFCTHVFLSCASCVTDQPPEPVFACDADGDPSLAAFGFCNASWGLEARVADLVRRLTLQEKVGFLVSGAANVDRLGIPKYGWRSGTKFSSLVPGATMFPQMILTAASFNATLFETIGKVVSTEARAMHNVGLAGLTFWSPNVNIFRDPRWGRGQETPGEDPLLSSKYASGYVRGLQQSDDGNADQLKVAACCKHYTAYDIENWKGVDRYHINTVVTQQDLEDTFQPPFKSCVLDGNVACVMCSYNQVNGKPTCADPALLRGILREKWNLNGYIVSDCNSMEVFYDKQHYTKTPEEAAAKAILAGLDLNCGSFLGQHTEAAVKGGLLNESVIDKAISNNFATLIRLGFFDGDPRKQLYGKLGPGDVCTPSNQELAREAARQGIVLLKNTAGSLPLSSTAIKSLAVIGPNANVTKTMIGNYEGTPCKYVTPLQGLAAVVSTIYVAGCVDVGCGTAQTDDAKKAAASADATVLVMGTDQSIERENFDRVNLNLPGQQSLLVSEVANVSKGPVILVIMSGGGMDVSFAKDDDKIMSILWVGYPGEAGGAAMADVIFGDHNPSGRLPMTWYPQSFADAVPMTNMNMRPDPATGYPGRTYRFYTGPTVYSFGDGLSYSDFSYSLVQAPLFVSVPLEEGHVCHSSACESLEATGEKCRTIDLCLSVKNVGRFSGGHTLLLFSSPPAGHGSPQKHLLGFEKVFLASQGEADVHFRIDICEDLGMVDGLGRRKVPLGKHVLHVGNLKHELMVQV